MRSGAVPLRTCTCLRRNGPRRRLLHRHPQPIGAAERLQAHGASRWASAPPQSARLTPNPDPDPKPEDEGMDSNLIMLAVILMVAAAVAVNM